MASVTREGSLPATSRLRDLGRARFIGRAGALALATSAAAVIVYNVGVRELPGALDPKMAQLWVLFLVFAVAELYVADARDRSELVALSPHEAGVVLGLFMLAPNELLAAQLAGATVALAGVSFGRLRPSVLILRIATLALGTCLALVVFHAIIDGKDHTWSARMGRRDHRGLGGRGDEPSLGYLSRPRDRLDEPVLVTASITAGAALASSSIALAAVALARNYDVATILLIVPFAACAVILRAYASERMRLKHLQTLYESMRTAQRTTGLDEGVAELLGTTRRLVRAEVARLVLFPRNGSAMLVASMTPARHDQLRPTTLSPAENRAVWTVAEAGTACLVSETRATEPPFEHLLDELGLREVMLTPLRVEAEIRGVLLVGDRTNADRFRTEHLRLLETYAEHAGVLIENDRLEESLTELTELKDQLRHQAFHDALTGLPNRMLFAERVGRSLADSEDGSTAVLFLDLDDFKTINDSLGHYVGDQLLDRGRAAGRVLHSPDRPSGPARWRRVRRPPAAHRGRGGPGHRGPPGSLDRAAFRDRPARHRHPRERRDRARRARRRGRRGPLAQCGRRDVRRQARGEARLRDRTSPRCTQRVKDRQELAFAIERAVDRGEIGVHYQPIVELEWPDPRRLRGARPLEPPGPRRPRSGELHPARRRDSGSWSRSERRSFARRAARHGPGSSPIRTTASSG